MLSPDLGIFPPTEGVAAAVADVAAAPDVAAAGPAISAWPNPSPRSGNAVASSSAEPPPPGARAFGAWTCCQCYLKTPLSFSPTRRIEKIVLCKTWF